MMMTMTSLHVSAFNCTGKDLPAHVTSRPRKLSFGELATQMIDAANHGCLEYFRWTNMWVWSPPHQIEITPRRIHVSCWIMTTTGRWCLGIPSKQWIAVGASAWRRERRGTSWCQRACRFFNMEGSRQMSQKSKVGTQKKTYSTCSRTGQNAFCSRVILIQHQVCCLSTVNRL